MAFYTSRSEPPEGIAPGGGRPEQSGNGDPTVDKIVRGLSDEELSATITRVLSQPTAGMSPTERAAHERQVNSLRAESQRRTAAKSAGQPSGGETPATPKPQETIKKGIVEQAGTPPEKGVGDTSDYDTDAGVTVSKGKRGGQYDAGSEGGGARTIPSTARPSGAGSVSAGGYNDDYSEQAGNAMYDPVDPRQALMQVMLDSGMNLGGPLSQRMLSQAPALQAAFQLQGAQDPGVTDASNISDLFKQFLIQAIQGGTIGQTAQQGLSTLHDPNFQQSMLQAGNTGSGSGNPLMDALLPMLADPGILSRIRQSLAAPGLGGMGVEGIRRGDELRAAQGLRQGRDSGQEIDWFKALLGG